MAPEAIIAGLLTLLGGTWTALVTGFFRGDLIPGHVYRREIKRADTATTQAERNASSISELSKAHTDERESHKKELAAKDAEIAVLQRQLRERPDAPAG